MADKNICLNMLLAIIAILTRDEWVRNSIMFLNVVVINDY
ncbi:hypothetical protein AC520_3361 [Enterobacter sp. OLF]|nr:hypothetical protein AC520_3361 [Enterobacter sp. OLF]